MNFSRWLLVLLTQLSFIAAPLQAARLSPCQGQFGAARGPAYSFTLEQLGVPISADRAGEIERSARGIYDSWGDLLAAKPPFVVDVELTLISDESEFARLKQQLAPELPDVTGFYVGASNRAVALQAVNSPEQTRRRALHEISHLITSTQVGPAPHWLAEGLAEFYEMIEPAKSGLVVRANDRHLALLQAQPPPPLEQFFATTPDQWHSNSSQNHYAVAWSLVYFMMGSAQGRGALGQTLQQSSTHSCGSYAADSFLGQAWPGGMADFELAWRNWLARQSFAPLDL